MTLIHKNIAGSRLFGTATANSDYDYKAVKLPTKEEVLLGKAYYTKQNSTGDKNSRNGADDVDMSISTFSKFLHEVNSMDTVALEMMFAPNMLGGTTLVDYLYNQRFKVMWNSKSAFLGYGQGQANKYIVRGDRLTTMEAIVAKLEPIAGSLRLNECKVLWEGILTYPGTSLLPGPTGHEHIDYLTVFGRQVPVTVKVSEALEVFRKPLAGIGKRTKAAAEQGGADWKGLYHANRVIDEGIELFSTGKLTFPCTHADYYVKVRNQELTMDAVLDRFAGKLQELEELKPISDFKEERDTEWVKQLTMQVHEQIVKE